MTMREAKKKEGAEMNQEEDKNSGMNKVEK
jgi:hypothetical protein